MHLQSSHRGTEWKVGLFVLTGFLVVAVLAIKFGKLGSGFQKYYTLTVEFQNASGLLKGNVVYLAGDSVGYAVQAPSLLPDRFAVTVPLRIREGVRIPKNAKFMIGSSGLMGDAFVGVDIPPEADFNDFYQDKAYIVGSRVKGLGDLTGDASDALGELKKRLVELREPIEDVGGRVLSDANIKNLNDTFANLRELSERLKNTSNNFDEAVVKVKTAAGALDEIMVAGKAAMNNVNGVVVSAQGVVKKVDDAASGLKPVLASFTEAAQSAEKTVESARSLLNKANNGQGALGLLLSDKETADNLRALIRNLKTRGVLWYKDKP